MTTFVTVQYVVTWEFLMYKSEFKKRKIGGMYIFCECNQIDYLKESCNILIYLS
jgi:hypothetical protein